MPVNSFSDSLASLSSPQSFFNGLTYHIVTFGCQMNKHDSERVAGLLDALGATPVQLPSEADIVVYMTCCVREAADVRLYGQVASLKSAAPAPVLGRRLIAIGGCIGQRDGDELVAKIPHVNVVFGTHNVAHLPTLLLEAFSGENPIIEVLAEGCVDNDADVGVVGGVDSSVANGAASSVAGSSANKKTAIRREHHFHAWLPIMCGCNNFCTYCIVPYVRGREQSRELDSIVSEAQSLVADGVFEITLLGQNVNSYGSDIYGKPRFADALRAVAATGIKRIRFATSHPKDINDDTIAAFAELPAVMPALHLPLQSGSDAILKAMNRNYTVERYKLAVEKVRNACLASGKGDIALSTDIIVGFPGETEADFEATMELVRSIGYAQVFTFIYSKREGTAAAKIVDDTPRTVIQARFERLVDLVQQSAWQCNQAELGSVVDVLIEGQSKRDSAILSGRSPKNQTVHAPLPASKDLSDYVGKIVPIKVNEAKTWYLRGVLCE